MTDDDFQVGDIVIPIGGYCPYCIQSIDVVNSYASLVSMDSTSVMRSPIEYLVMKWVKLGNVNDTEVDSDD